MGIFDKLFGKKSKESEVKDVGIEKGEVKKINAGLNTPNKIYLENSEVHIKRGEEALARNDLEKSLLEFKYAVIYSSCKGHPPNERAVNYLRGEKLGPLNVKRTTKAQSLFDEGSASLEKRDYHNAITMFNKAINLCPIAAVPSFMFRGKALLMVGRYQEAIDDFSIALQYTPKVAEGYFDRGQAYHKIGNNAAARKDFNMAIKLDPQYEDAKKILQEEEEETKEQEDIEGLINEFMQGNDAPSESIETLKGIEDTKAVVEFLIQALKDENWGVRRRRAANALGNIGDEKAVEPLISALNEENVHIRRATAGALGHIGDERAVEPLILALNDEDKSVRTLVAGALGKIRDKRAVEPLILALNDDEEDVRWYASVSLGEIGDKKAVEPLTHALKDEGKIVRCFAAESLGKIGDKRAVEPLIQILKSEKEDSRCFVARALGEIGDKRANESLTQALKDNDNAVQKAAKEALEKIRIKKS